MAVVGQEGLDDGRQQRDDFGRVLAHLLVGVVDFLVEQQRAVDRQRAAAFGIGLGRQQHLAHVGVHDDRVCRLVLGFHARQAAHLDAVLGVGQRVLEGHFGQAQRLVAHAQTGGVHHHEHRSQALVGLADQAAAGAVHDDLGGGVAVDAHLVFQAGAEDAVAIAQRTIGLDVELGHHKQADALAALGCIGQAGKHQMNDVGRHVVFAGADENLVAGEFVAAVGLRLGLGAQQAQVSAAMRFGQTHGAGPLTADQLGQVSLLLLVGAVRVQGLIGAVGQTGIHGPGLVGRIQHLVQALVQHKRQALATVFGIAAQRGPAAGDILRIRLLEASGRRDFMGGQIQLAALGVTADVQGESHLGSKLAGFFQHRIDGVGIHLGMFRQGLELVGDIQHFVHHKLHVAQWWGVLRHGCVLFGEN